MAVAAAAFAPCWGFGGGGGGGGGSGARFLVTQHRGRARTGRAGLETYLAPSAEANSVEKSGTSEGYSVIQQVPVKLVSYAGAGKTSERRGQER